MGGNIKTKWHIKEFSELTQTSIRMLRYYDKTGLLNPSYREANGYRCYTEPDLVKLQQIIALRYFYSFSDDFKHSLITRRKFELLYFSQIHPSVTRLLGL